jgi:dTDP-D-glucose 4,6-dehydratase
MVKENRVIFDTNIYGFLVREKELPVLVRNITEGKSLIVYGCSIIKKEFRKNKNKQIRDKLIAL